MRRFYNALWISMKENPVNRNTNTHKGAQNIQLRARCKEASNAVVRAAPATVAYALQPAPGSLSPLSLSWSEKTSTEFLI